MVIQRAYAEQLFAMLQVCSLFPSYAAIPIDPVLQVLHISWLCGFEAEYAVVSFY